MNHKACLLSLMHMCVMNVITIILCKHIICATILTEKNTLLRPKESRNNERIKNFTSY